MHRSATHWSVHRSATHWSMHRSATHWSMHRSATHWSMHTSATHWSMHRSATHWSMHKSATHCFNAQVSDPLVNAQVCNPLVNAQVCNRLCIPLCILPCKPLHSCQRLVTLHHLRWPMLRLRSDNRACACSEWGQLLPSMSYPARFLALQGDVCNTCGHGVVRSFLTFEPLPLLQFQVASHISDDQVQLF